MLKNHIKYLRGIEIMISTRKPIINEETKLLNLEESHFCDVKSCRIKPNKLHPHFVAFANSDGGEIYIGVEDRKSTGERLVGFRTKEEANEIINVLAEKTDPTLIDYSVEFIDFREKGYVLHLTIPKSPLVHYTSDGSCFIRRNASTKEVKGATITELAFSKGIFSYETIIKKHVAINEILNGAYLIDYIKRIESSQEPLNFLEKLKLIQRDGENHVPTVSCLLFFSDDPQIGLNTKCGIKIYRLKTSQSEYNRDFLEDRPKNIRGPIELQIIKTKEVIAEYLQKSMIEIGNKYVDYSYPSNALHEIIVNAIIHRDYSINDDIHIRIFNDRLEFESPGRLPGSMTTSNLLVGRSSRNPLIERLLNQLPDMYNHDIGDGFNTIYKELKKFGFVEPKILELNNSVLVTVYHHFANNSEDTIKLLTSIQINAEQEDFKSDKKETEETYLFVKEKVSIQAFLPNYPDTMGSCLIIFNRFPDVMITFNFKDILNDLFQGLYTNAIYKLRRFIVAIDKEKHIYYVQLGNNRFSLNEIEVAQLCDIIDDFSEKYLEGLRKIELHFGTFPYEKSLAFEAGIPILKIKRSFYKEIMEFVQEHDYEKGDTSWHIFDANPTMIKLYSKKSDERYDAGHHVILYPKQVQNESYSSFKTFDEEVAIVWEPFHDFGNKKSLMNFNDRYLWSAEKSYEWFTNELIPYVIYYNEMKKRKPLFNTFKRNTFEDFRQTLKIKDYFNDCKVRKKINLSDVLTIKRLLELVNNMQYFYHNRGSQSGWFTAEELISLYQSIVICLKHTPLNEYYYISGNLRFATGTTLDGILSDIDRHISTIENGKNSFSIVDTALRCLIVSLRDNKSNLNISQIGEMVGYLTPLFNKQQKIDEIDRYS
ncbi:RNA-binding domain-containing protein [Paenibacillus sp. GSMTC-2017]|uniref:RNA-binding domain-containing protein n=1 Tax=Paenibacillus sp. GSMTC-2017 TaxID=2794350 RepID=UPI001E282984|nr:RNA-binding domain-containing protein [Paenibacillus sp. GSMTC-2017]